jgi:hypothetical protein
MQTGYVLVGSWSGNGSPITLALVQNQTVATSARTNALPLATDASQTVAVYIPAAP